MVPLADVRCPLAVLILALFSIRCRKGLAAMVLAVFENLGHKVRGAHNASGQRLWIPFNVATTQLTFFRTLDETLGRGIG